MAYICQHLAMEIQKSSPRRGCKVHQETRFTPGKTQAGVSLGKRRPLLPGFAAGARCLGQSQASNQPVQEQVATKGRCRQDLLKPGEGRFHLGRRTRGPEGARPARTWVETVSCSWLVLPANWAPPPPWSQEPQSEPPTRGACQLYGLRKPLTSLASTSSLGSLQSGPAEGLGPSDSNPLSLMVVPHPCPHSTEDCGSADKISILAQVFLEQSDRAHTCTAHKHG